MTELEELMLQKKQLDMRIKMLKNPSMRISGIVKYETVEDAAFGYKFQVSALTNYAMSKWDHETHKKVLLGASRRYVPFIRETSKQDVVNRIDDIIVALNEVKRMISREE